MDQAWAMEEEFWEAGTSGRTAEFYAKVLTTDAFVVVPSGVLMRDDLLHMWQDRAPWDRYELSDRHDQLVNGETVLLSYRIAASSRDVPDYRARVSSLYTWVTGWALVFRQHTPEIGVTF
ncbi:MAG TPA: DUF4440 domain-containing protein [Kineosporiaceae bacterium]|nr:DUF4440 domain-containing protein [Kineosporiaceae bacterium]